VTEAKRKPPAAGKGRVKGTPNKTTAALKDAILHAFEKVGGADYLEMVAQTDPKTFCTLIGKVLPMTVQGQIDGTLKVTWSSGKPDA
jgi:hypothetical protein